MFRKIILLLVISFFSSQLFSQMDITISGIVKEKETQQTIPYANILVKTVKGNAFITGTATNDIGRFSIDNIKPGNYILEVSIIGFKTKAQTIYVGSLSKFLDIKTIELSEDSISLDEIVVTSAQDEISSKMDKKTYSLKDNISQNGGSVLQAMQNLPSVTLQEGKVQLRGNDKVTVLIDGKQTSLTGFGNQTGLDNIPA